METTGKKTRGRPRRALTTTLALALLAAALLAGPALAAGHEGPGKGAKPGKPVAKAPSGTIASTTPTFTWSKARGAARYELRVYESGSRAGLTGGSPPDCGGRSGTSGGSQPPVCRAALVRSLL